MGYEEGNDADSLRHNPAFKLTLGRLPDDAAVADSLYCAPEMLDLCRVERVDFLSILQKLPRCASMSRPASAAPPPDRP